MSAMTHQIDRLGAGRRVDDSQAFAAGRPARARAVISLALTVHPANVLPVHRKLGACLAAATLALATCASTPHGAADPTPQPPFPIGQIDTPVHVKESSGGTADITLQQRDLVPARLLRRLVLQRHRTDHHRHLPTPFKYNETYVVAGYGGDQPFTHPNDAHWRGGDYMVDYTKINKMPPLPTGSVTNGQSAHGFIGYGCNLNEGDLYIKFCDPTKAAPPTKPAGKSTPESIVVGERNVVRSRCRGWVRAGSRSEMPGAAAADH